jgi:23S rRNA pseudouridine1911/1915/1917 synthase
MKLSDNAEVQYVDNHLAVAAKPCGMLTQPDDTGSSSLEAALKLWIKKEYQKQGNVFLHAIHRLDRAVSGLVLFARTSKALSRLNEQSRLQEIQRIYLAEVESLPEKKDGQLDHYLIHGDHRAIIAKKDDPEAKHARLYYKTIKYKTLSTLVEIELETGRYHQIRAQFSAIGHPIVGDRRYGSQNGDGGAIRLHCKKLAFQHPVTKELLTFETPAPFD